MKFNSIILLFIFFQIIVFTSCDQDPDAVTMRNLINNSPWRIDSLHLMRFSSPNSVDFVQEWDTVLYNYGILSFSDNASSFYYEDSGTLTLTQGGSVNFGADIGILQNKILLRLSWGFAGIVTTGEVSPANGTVVQIISQFPEPGLSNDLIPFPLGTISYYPYYAYNWYISKQ